VSRTNNYASFSVSALADLARFQTVEQLAAKGFENLQPHERLSVSEAAEKYMRFGSGSGNTTPWSAKKTPYLLEPMNTLTSLDYTGVVFVGPARTGKSAMFLAWLTHTVMTDPADMMVVHMDRENARKWSKGELQRYLEASPHVRSRQLTNRKDDNTFDKEFDSGMRFLLTYPTASNLSGITMPRLWLMDYERMNENVDGEGNPSIWRRSARRRSSASV
jgi:phage terminase large subunit GpA-like protein